MWLILTLQASERIIEYGPQQGLALLEGEELKETTKLDIDFYDPFHGVMNYQVPIHKSITAPGYRGFFGIGVGFESDESVLAAAYLHDPSYTIIDTSIVLDKSTGLKSYRFFMKKGELFNHKYIFTIPAPLMTLVVNEISSDSTTIARIFSDKDYVSKRRVYE